MKFGHMKDGILIPCVLPIRLDGADIFTEDAALMLRAGEKEIVESEKPVNTEEGRYVASFTETDTQILVGWVFVAYTEDELNKKKPILERVGALEVTIEETKEALELILSGVTE